ncbi:uncharacterized protein [Ptychodera flava]|uniref:uncharacterized protein n=1 Tax=Ptychodera flava TaxID=63121 RepID=UPI00396A8246
MSSMIPSVVSSVYHRRSSWKTTLTPTIGPFNGKKTSPKSPAASPSPRKKGYWCRSTEKDAAEKKRCSGDESPRIRNVYIGERYKESEINDDSDDNQQDENS